MAVSGRLGQSGIGGEVSIRVDLKKLGIVAMTNKVTGAFRGGAFQMALSEVNHRAARSIQRGMVDQLEGAVAETGRIQRGTKRLEMSLMDDRNIEVYANTFTVGRPSWLDRSPAALYWRRIEEGDASTFDAKIMFTDNFATFHRPVSAGGTNTRMPQGRGVFVVNIGPFPKYEYSLGGRRALREFRFSREYTQALKTVGLPLT